MKGIKMLFAALLVASATAAPMQVRAESASTAPQLAGRAGIAPSLDYYGLKVKRIVASATGTLLASGELFLDAICPFGGTLGKYSMAFDTGDVIGANGAAPSYAISPRVYTTNDTTSAQHGMQGCWVPPAPIKVVNALYGRQDDAGHSTLFLVHCSSGTNPCSL